MLNSVGRLSKRSVYNEIYAKLPSVGELFTLESLVIASCLPAAKKIPPYSLKAFLGYDHSSCSLPEYSWSTPTEVCAYITNSTVTWDAYVCEFMSVSDVAYTAEQSFTAYCPSGNIFYTSTKTATSTVSQADANQIAYNAAVSDAQTKLVCPTITSVDYTWESAKVCAEQ
jgi:hypothetical protein